MFPVYYLYHVQKTYRMLLLQSLICMALIGSCHLFTIHYSPSHNLGDIFSDILRDYLKNLNALEIVSVNEWTIMNK